MCTSTPSFVHGLVLGRGERVTSMTIIKLVARDLGWLFVPIPVGIFNVLVRFMHGIYKFRKCVGLSVKGVPDHLFWTFYRQQLTYDNTKAVHGASEPIPPPPNNLIAVQLTLYDTSSKAYSWK
eukprot:6425771-Amphidinium_carterae.1